MSAENKLEELKKIPKPINCWVKGPDGVERFDDAIYAENRENDRRFMRLLVSTYKTAMQTP